MIPLQSCAEFYTLLQQQLSLQSTIYNVTALLAMSEQGYVIPTALFDTATLAAYSSYNLGLDISPAQRQLFTPERGGAQGDYHHRMQDKITNVVDCLTRFPHSKRALITICPDPYASHQHDELAKCLREVYFRREGSVLHASCTMRAQAFSIFPKNIHFLGKLMELVASRIDPQLSVGSLFYHAVCLTSDRR